MHFNVFEHLSGIQRVTWYRVSEDELYGDDAVEMHGLSLRDMKVHAVNPDNIPPKNNYNGAPTNPKQAMEETGDSRIIAKHTFDQFLENSGSHGLPNIYRAQHLARKVFWIIMWLGANAGLFYQVYKAFDTFLAYEVSVSVSVTYSTKIDFPAVTFCNMNPVQSSKARGLASLQNFFSTNNYQLSGEKKLMFNWDVAYNSLTDAEKSSIQQPLDDFVMAATFRDSFIQNSEFTEINNPEYGPCYVFNWGTNASVTPYTAHMAGVKFGLHLKLYIDSMEYEGLISHSQGIRVYIHRQQTYPFPEDQGYNLAPGKQYAIGVKLTEINRLESPYTSKCVDITTNAEARQYDIYAEYYNLTYTRKGCYRTCFQQHLIDLCACLDTHTPTEGDLLEPYIAAQSGGNGSAALAYCRETQAGVTCFETTEDAWESGDLTCDCPVPCKDYIFNTQYSLAMWPSTAYRAYLFPALSTKYPSLANITGGVAGASEPDNEFVAFDIYFEDLNYELIYQSVAYDQWSLLADLGGILGLWLGISIIAVMEFVELAVDLLIIGFQACREKMRTK